MKDQDNLQLTPEAELTPSGGAPTDAAEMAKKAERIELQAKLARRATSARMDVILIVALTVLNIVMIFAGIDRYFLFSASLPYYLTFFAMLYTGNLSEGMIDYAANGWTEENFLPGGFLWAAIIFSLIVVGLYTVCFFASKSKKQLPDGTAEEHFFGGWIITATVLFAIDTLVYIAAMVLLFGFDASMLWDLAIHIYVLVTLIMGAVAAVKLEKLKRE